MIIELASVAARYLEENGPTPHFSLTMETLTRTFTRILQALQINLKRSYARRYVEASNERDLLRDCEKELQHCLDTFQIRSHIATSVAITRRTKGDEVFEGQVSNVLHPVKSLLAQTVTDSETIPETLEISDEPEDLPPKPQISYGRENELSELVCMFSQPLQAHAVLLGQGGSGKSILALELLHDPEIKHKFRHQRLFVKCKSARTTWDLLSRLGSAMGLPESEPSAYKDTVLNTLVASSVPCLVVFDDLDDAWDPPSTKLDVEDFLTELSNISTVSLLLTLRGTQRPMGPSYSKPAPAPLGSLSPSAARETFFAISDVVEDGEDAPLVDVLLQLVGYLPRAITTLAQLAQYEPLPFLLERYREEGTAMLCDGEVSMDESIEATLYSARISECPAALEVLSVLARFPQGTPKTEVSALVTNGGRLPGAIVNKCMSVLHCTSLLVVVSGDGQPQCETVKVPEVIRTYLERHVLDGGRYRRIEEL
ncbi:hypothetical protein R3P38DRAFT_3302495 [Favolaschia claudopus]|uniref:ORC1/DEAH AAA+ ATPase domain-containing protein n=1 Tax=Favolaschia claudopus TaxID=2862362 RepID=A0AAW0E7P3_9AGAR